jgi:hypothetical protein
VDGRNPPDRLAEIAGLREMTSRLELRWQIHLPQGDAGSL